MAILTRSRLLRSKAKALLFHALLSATLLIGPLMGITHHFYPDLLWARDGGWQVIRIVVGVDLVLGPLLTAIVYVPGKKTLKMDLAVIGLIQVLAFTWGAYTMWSQRPRWIIMAYDSVYTLTVPQLENGWPDGFDRSPWTSAETAWSVLPDDPHAAYQVLATAVHAGRAFFVNARTVSRWDDRAQAWAHRYAIHEESLIKWPDGRTALARWHHAPEFRKDAVLLPFKARYSKTVVALDPATGNILYDLDLRPIY